MPDLKSQLQKTTERLRDWQTKVRDAAAVVAEEERQRKEREAVLERARTGGAG